ncbi:MAG: type transport system permease protein [Thermoplasmata archaeon]|jgi:ABC-2 type transport system permease protein|nr:type transport system permease protein [Thermoplasmata archaeon]
MSSYAAEVWYNFKRWMIKTVRNPFVIGFGLIQPIIWLLLFPNAMKGASSLPLDYVVWFAPVVAIQTALFAGNGSGIGLVEDMRIGVFNKLLATPMDRSAMFVGKTLAGAATVAVQVLLIEILAAIVTKGASAPTGVLGALGVIAIGILFSLGFAGLSNIIALATKSTEATIIIGNFILLPLLFASGAFAPPDVLPGWLKFISSINPVNYGIEAARHLMLPQSALDSGIPLPGGGTGHLVTHSLAFDLAVIVVFDAILVLIAAMMLRRATASKPR